MQNTFVIWWYFIFSKVCTYLLCMRWLLLKLDFWKKKNRSQTKHTDNTFTKFSNCQHFASLQRPCRCQSNGTKSTRGSIWHFGKLSWQMVLHLFLLLFLLLPYSQVFFLIQLHSRRVATVHVTVLFYTNNSLLLNKYHN